MSYVYWPPRTTNYFPPGVPYLAALGDYAADLAAYKKQLQAYEVDYKKWYAEKKKYEAALAAYDLKVKSIIGAYEAARSQYNQDKKAWDSVAASYQIAINAWAKDFNDKKQANTVKSQQIAQTFGLKLPQSYFDAGACISASDQAYFKKNCTVVKGLGVVSYGSACGMMRLPVCAFGPKPTLPPEPQPPGKPSFPAKPTLRAEPVKPTAPTAPPSTPASTPVPVTTPVSIPSSVPTAEPEVEVLVQEEPQRNVLMGGLLLVALAGGGYLVYRTLRKPKAKAA